jgi:hypothetical protein
MIIIQIDNLFYVAGKVKGDHYEVISGGCSDLSTAKSILAIVKDLR